jgi:hypothetical protein
VVRSGGGSTAQTAKSKRGRPSELRSIPKTSLTTPNSKAATPSQTATATSRSTFPLLAELGFRVKEMIGGIEYWKREGYATEGELVEADPEAIR